MEDLRKRTIFELYYSDEKKLNWVQFHGTLHRINE